MIWTANWKGNGNHDAFDMRHPGDGFGAGWYSSAGYDSADGKGYFGQGHCMVFGRVVYWGDQNRGNGDGYGPRMAIKSHWKAIY